MVRSALGPWALPVFGGKAVGQVVFGGSEYAICDHAGLWRYCMQLHCQLVLPTYWRGRVAQSNLHQGHVY